MHPDVVVALLQAAVIALAAVAVHEADIADFHIGAVLHDQTKTVEYGIGTNTLTVMPAFAVSIIRSPLGMSAGSVILPINRRHSGRFSLFFL